MPFVLGKIGIWNINEQLPAKRLSTCRHEGALERNLSMSSRTCSENDLIPRNFDELPRPSPSSKKRRNKFLCFLEENEVLEDS
jgi:hypothetical protein